MAGYVNNTASAAGGDMRQNEFCARPRWIDQHAVVAPAQPGRSTGLGRQVGDVEVSIGHAVAGRVVALALRTSTGSPSTPTTRPARVAMGKVKLPSPQNRSSTRWFAAGFQQLQGTGDHALVHRGIDLYEIGWAKGQIQPVLRQAKRQFNRFRFQRHDAIRPSRLQQTARPEARANAFNFSQVAVAKGLEVTKHEGTKLRHRRRLLFAVWFAWLPGHGPAKTIVASWPATRGSSTWHSCMSATNRP